MLERSLAEMWQNQSNSHKWKGTKEDSSETQRGQNQKVSTKDLMFKEKTINPKQW